VNAERGGTANEAGPDRGAPPPGASIWIVNADHWPRAYLRAELIERGYDATGFETLRDAALRLALSRSHAPALLIIDMDMDMDMLDLHDLAADRESRTLFIRCGVPLLVIAPAAGRREDEDSAPLVEVLRRPVAIGDVADAVDRRGFPHGAQLR
jgi:hypothetical protein